MFTLFDLFRLASMIGGAALLGALGWRHMGIVGCVVGIPVGWILGGLIGQLPFIIGLTWIARRLQQQTNDELLDELHSGRCPTPNLHLLELGRRGYDIQRELPFIHNLLSSDDMNQRMKGWVVLTSAFPEFVEQIPDYNPTAPTEDCRINCRPLADAVGIDE